MRRIVRSLSRHPMLPLLVLLQVAVACAMACNIAFLLSRQLAPLWTSDGIGRPQNLLLAYHIAARGKQFSQAENQAVEAALAAIPGVASVSVMPMLPMVSFMKADANVEGKGEGTRANTVIYAGDHLLRTLDLKLVAGRDFRAEERMLVGGCVGMCSPGPVIITRALAERLFPDGQALGGRVIVDDSDVPQGRTVIGIVAHLARNDMDEAGHHRDYAMFYPALLKHWMGTGFAIRTHGHDNEAIREQAGKRIRHILAGRLFSNVLVRSYAQVRAQAQAPYRAAVWLLCGVSAVVLLITLAGIMGMTGYWVQQRTHAIGVRRALGARVAQIRREIQLENLLVVGAGLVLGVLAAVGLNLWLMQHYEVPRMPWTYLPVGAAVLLVLGQLAALAPAIRASRVPPVVATRAA